MIKDNKLYLHNYRIGNDGIIKHLDSFRERSLKDISHESFEVKKDEDGIPSLWISLLLKMKKP